MNTITEWPDADGYDGTFIQVSDEHGDDVHARIHGDTVTIVAMCGGEGGSFTLEGPEAARFAVAILERLGLAVELGPIEVEA